MKHFAMLAILIGIFICVFFLYEVFIAPLLLKETQRQEIVFGGDNNIYEIKIGETRNYFITTPYNLRLPKDEYMLSTNSNAISCTIKGNRLSIMAKEEGIAKMSISNKIFDYSYEILIVVKSFPYTEKIKDDMVEIE